MALHKRPLSALALIAVMIAGPAPRALAHPHPAPENLPAVPDSPAGQAAAAFAAMWNDGSADAVLKFERAYASAKRLGAVPMEERPGRVAALRDRWGNLKIAGVTATADNAITVAGTTASGDLLELEFEMSAAEPGKLDAVKISSDGGGAPAPVAGDVKSDTVKGVAKALEEGYVFPAVGKEMAALILKNLESGVYEKIENDRAFAKRLTEDLRSISHDGHLAVRTLPPDAPRTGAMHPPADRGDGNFAFRKAEVLPGNIGYIQFDAFMEGEGPEKTAAAALAFVAHADALIFDLRTNGGGSPEMIRFITSFLFDKPTHLNDMVDRDGKIVEEYWTHAQVPGQRFANDLPVYVLTSSRTFSGAEEFSYNLKNLKRATIIGETTGGGAHPVRFERVNNRFGVGVPFMRARNPISGTNWEGKGVEPDVKVPASQTLERAIELARQATRPR